MWSSIHRLLSLLSFSYLFSCRQKVTFLTAPDNKSLLWEVSGNSLPQPSYFLGTMHLMCADEAIISPVAKSIIKQVNEVYLEVDMDNMGELLNGMLDLNMKDDISLVDLLPPQDYERIKSFFGENKPDMPFYILEKQQPLMITSTLYEIYLNCDHKKGIDIMVIHEASKQKKETKGLETMAFQLSILNSISYEEQAKELAGTIANIDKYKTAMEELVKAYKLQDIDYLHELSTKEETGIANHLGVLLYDRNKRWVDQFENISNKKPALYAVGAGHLGGEQGVINLLKEKGYTVRALSN